MCNECETIKAAALAVLSDVRAMQSSDHEFYFEGFTEYQAGVIQGLGDNDTAAISWPNLAISADALAVALGQTEYAPDWERSDDNE